MAILGCGTIAQSAHLPAYQKLRRRRDRCLEPLGRPRPAIVRERFPFVGRVYASAEELLADPEVRYVDLATGPEGRLDWIEAAVEAGKHVLAQKPLTLSTEDLVRAARGAGTRRGRRASGSRSTTTAAGRPPWRAATLLLRSGAVGEVVGVTHLHDKPLPPLAGTPFDDVPHMLLTDYLLHWVDITRTLAADGSAGDEDRSPRCRPSTRGCRASPKPPATPGRRRARSRPSPVRRRPADRSATPVTSEPGCPFWMHGTDGDAARQRAARLRPPRSSTTVHGARPVPLPGAWFVDGFAATMGELMCAVGRGPAAGELRGRRCPVGRAGPRRAGVRRARRLPVVRTPVRGRRVTSRPPSTTSLDEVAGRPVAGARLRRGLAELEPGDLVPRRARPACARRGLAAHHALPPGHADRARSGVQAEGLLVVDPGDRQPGALLRRHRPVDVPTVTATLVDECVLVGSTGARRGRPQAADAETALATYADGFARRPGAQRLGAHRRPCGAPGTATSRQVTAADVLENLDAFDRHDLPVDVVQVDDGWSPAWARVWWPRTGSARWRPCVDEVRATGRRAGIWVAPFVVGARSDAGAPSTPTGWSGRAGRNWGDDLVGLDLTHPGVLDLLARALHASGRPRASTTSSSTSSTPVRCPGAASRT